MSNKIEIRLYYVSSCSGSCCCGPDKNKIEFEMNEPPYQKGTGQLLPDGRLMTIGGDYTIYNIRIE